MLYITVPAVEMFDERTQEFFYTKEYRLQLEHSLVSLSKWESKWCKTFLSRSPKTEAETRDYIRCMTLTQNVDPIVYSALTQDNIATINRYIAAPMTATRFNPMNEKRSGQEITAELIYYWMIVLGIPFECQKWHLNRLLTLIRVCSIKSKPPENMKKKDILKQNAAINAARRNRTHSKG